MKVKSVQDFCAPFVSVHVCCPVPVPVATIGDMGACVLSPDGKTFALALASLILVVAVDGDAFGEQVRLGEQDRKRQAPYVYYIVTCAGGRNAKV